MDFGYTKEIPKIFDNLSIKIVAGEYLAIIGPNGSGKSTLAKLLVGLIDEDQALEKQIEISGRVGMVFQNPESQFVGTTVEDDIAFGLENYQVPREEMLKRVETVAKQVGISDLLNNAPQELSGGQQQRVAIASTIVLEPDLIIFDEATSMLDPKGRDQVIGLIQSIHQKNENMAIVTITHDLDEAALADRIVLLDAGKIVADGKADEILNDHKLLRAHQLLPNTAGQIVDSLKKAQYQLPKNIAQQTKTKPIIKWLSSSKK
jgi:energy-coupling factor transport system ATP-binding protein